MRSATVAALLFVPALALARDLEPGTVELSGDSSFIFTSQKLRAQGFQDVDANTTSLSLGGFVFVARNLGVGAFVSYDEQSASSGATTTKSRSSLLGPALSFHLPIAPQVSLAVQGAIGVASLESDGSTADGWGWGDSAGIRYFAIPSVSFDGGVSILSVSVKSSGLPIDQTGFGLSVGVSVYLGG
jgi:hypothetical protein